MPLLNTKVETDLILWATDLTLVTIPYINFQVGHPFLYTMLTYMVMLPMPSSKLGVRNVIAEFILVLKAKRLKMHVSSFPKLCLGV